MPGITERLGAEVLVVQGAVGTYLQDRGFEGCMPALNLEEPEAVEDLHRLYRLAGADCALTNTFLATSSQLAREGLSAHTQQINVAGVRLAQAAEFPHVLAAMGPCGVAVEPGSGLAALRARDQAAEKGDVADAEGPAPGYACAREQYLEQAAALASAGPDAVLLQTFTDLDDALAAMDAVRQACDLPVLACMAFVGPDAPDPADCARALELAGAVAVGCNCMDFDATVAALEAMCASCSLPLVALPSAGTPHQVAGRTVWPAGPDDFADASVRLLRAGARVIGSCCGSTPACTGAVYAAVGGLEFPRA